MAFSRPPPTNCTLTANPTTHITTVPKMNRQNSSKNIIIQAHDLTFLSSPTPSYSFHGSNSSHSRDSGKGGRTYHVPNYATSYANEKTHLISVVFDEHKGATKLIIAIVFMFLLLLGSSAYIVASKPEKNFLVCQNFGTAERSEVNEPLVQHKEAMGPPTALSTANPISGDWANRDKAGENIGTTLGLGLYWDELQRSTHCTAFGTRRYSARLRNVSFWMNRTRACLETPVQIHGITVPSPDECEVDWLLGRVKGFWNVNFKENDCSPVWGNFADKGCINRGSHQRLFRARLWNIKKGENNLRLCGTAPAYVAGISRARPDSCEDQGFWGTYGTWVVEDPKC
ncbi:hypothetical protein Agabi119p4_4231 [Agaricus bisporus var. burnettii]|uniref:Uncharacterized protein n=1 Tax=Agaricus bisporus var. burnettii TaxID=192524 RepID=A0A8H7F320_AGABI|nr:hypothetical protein Agabi119p4_4231 [Agaricus bisporus var. burnettii]